MTIPAGYAFTFWGARVECHCQGGRRSVSGWVPFCVTLPGWYVVTVWGGSIRVTLPGRCALLGDVHTAIRPIGPLGVLFLLGVI